jgi:hypothetical protein
MQTRNAVHCDYEHATLYKGNNTITVLCRWHGYHHMRHVTLWDTWTHFEHSRTVYFQRRLLSSVTVNCCVKISVSIQAFTRHLTVACRRREHVFPKRQDAITHSHSFMSQVNGILSSTAAKTQNSQMQTATRNISGKKKNVLQVCVRKCANTNEMPLHHDSKTNEAANFAQKIHTFAT